MPRRLPWRDNVAATTTTKSRPRPSKPVPPKRKRTDKSDLESDSEQESPKVASSPPFPIPTAPPESFMRDGLDKDDKYRLVEDELLFTAQKFTVHLHASEYRRQQQMAQSQNVSRPAVRVMSDHTKRRVKGTERAETQRKVMGRLKADNPEDSDSADGLPYIGTTLHSLMDSPKRRGVLLSKFAPLPTTTRSAAGYKKYGAENISSSSDNDDDDLDAPVRALKFFKRVVSSVVKASSGPGGTLAAKSGFQSIIKSEPAAFTIKSTSSKAVSRNPDIQTKVDSFPTTTFTSKTIKPSMRTSGQEQSPPSSPPLIKVETARVSRFELARQRKAQEEQLKEKDRTSQNTRDIIPSFL